MAEITPCPACGKNNPVPAVAAGKPVCAGCGPALAWIVEATDVTFDGTAATGVPVLGAVTTCAPGGRGA